jgi:6-phosphogluconolactonase
MPELTIFSTPSALYVAAAQRFADEAYAAICERGRFVVALSGGQTPLPVYRLLAERADIDWRRTFLTWADERCVPPESDASNVGAARLALLDRIPIPRENVVRIEGERSPLEAADAYEVCLRRLLGTDAPLDLVILGLGADGHVASLFPRHQALRETERWILPVHAPAQPSWRVTMTLPLLNASRRVTLLAVGSEKADAVRRCCAGEDLPASRVHAETGTTEWLADVAACSGS